ncbi:MAG: DEAD/DEAH box helicase family protein [Lentisphaeria bacterium]|nr:DEAD/DEAH box helicase family protein [Lentisphaeria bacterium]
MDKRNLSERDICTKFIMPNIKKAGWDLNAQIREEVSFTDGRIHVRGRLTKRGPRRRADYILYYRPNIPIAVIEAKDNTHSVGAGLQQALEYARILDLPFVFSSNGDGFIFHDRTAGSRIETELALDDFPSPQVLWEKYKSFKGIATSQQERIVRQDYYVDASGREPRYYQQIAINRTVEAIAKAENRIFLVMATGTGKTYTAFQIIYRLWKAGVKKRILFLADRNALIDQTRRGDFRHFRDKMTVVQNHRVDKSYEIYLALYQGLSGSEPEQDIFREFSPDFFDLVVVDECHRGSARADSTWRRILEHYKSATHIGLTATPKETTEISNMEYFGDPIYTYSLRQGIEDGFLAPYRVIRVGLNVDLEGWRPPKGYLDKNGQPVEDRVYNRSDFDRTLVVEDRRVAVAKKVTEFLRGSDPFSKTIAFCVDIEHADGMRRAIVNENIDLVKANPKYVMKITGDDNEGKRELDNFTNPEETYPVIATTSKLMTTGIDAQTCKVIVLDSNIQSMTEFKQIIGRGTRINEEYGKRYFTIIDFRNVTDLFADSDFDGDPVKIKVAGEAEDLSAIEAEEEAETVPDTGPDGDDQPDIYGEPADPPYLPIGEDTDDGPRPKVFVNGVDVTALVTRELYFDTNGKPITTSLKDYTRGQILGEYTSLDDFLNHWCKADRKAAIVEELENEGILVEELRNAVNRELDLFDIICHVAYDQPPLTRRERAEKVKKRDCFAKYGETARAVLGKLLDKYADEGIENVESLEILKVQPFETFGSPHEIVKAFGGKKAYLAAVRQLENELYQPAVA